MSRSQLKAELLSRLASFEKASKAKTYPEAQKELMDHLKSKGWTVVSHLKIPHATNRSGDIRIWFKKQATYLSEGGPRGRHDFGDARSLHVDLRKMTPEQFMTWLKSHHDV